MKLKIAVLLFSFLMMTAGAAAAPKLSSVEIKGKKYYVYDVKKGDSLYGIAKMYGWNTNDIIRYNPKVSKNLEKGARLYYPENPIADELPQEELSEAPFLPVTHLVKKGETVYGISRMYGIPVSRIYEMHPSSRYGIKEGEVITLSQETASAQGERGYKYYTIKKGDTLYSVANRYNTTVESLMSANPGVSEKNFKSDEVIRIPLESKKQMVKEVSNETTIAGFEPYKVNKDDTWESISRKTGVDKETLLEANNNKKLKKNETITVPDIDTVKVEKEVVFTDPRSLTPEGREDLYEEIHGLIPDSLSGTVKVAYLMAEPESRKDLEFSRGFLAGLDNLSSSSLDVKFKIIDGTLEEKKVIEQLDAFAPNLLIVTNDKEIPEYISTYSQNRHVATVNTFDVKSEAYLNNSYMIQYLTPSNFFNEEISDAITDMFNGYNLLLIGNDDDTDNLFELLKSKMTDSPAITLTVEEAALYPFDNDMKYLVYVNVTKKNEVSEVLDLIEKSKEDAIFAEVCVLGRPNWVVYDDNAMRQKFYKSDVYIPSRFYLNLDDQTTQDFLTRYKGMYEKGPIKSYPLYAGVGYDVATYFIPMISRTSGDLNNAEPSSDLLQSNVELKRLSNWSGFYNPDCYLVRFTPYDKVEKIVVR